MLSGVKLTTLSSRRSQCGYTIHCGFGKPARRRSAQGLQRGGPRQAADANVPGLLSAGAQGCPLGGRAPCSYEMPWAATEAALLGRGGSKCGK